MEQFELRDSEQWPPIRTRSSNSHSSRRRRLSSSMTMDMTRFPDPPMFGSLWAGLGEDLLPINGVSGSERVRTITNDALADACALLESHTQRAILEDCLWNAPATSFQQFLSNGVMDSSPLIGLDSPLKPLLSRGIAV